MQNSTFKLLMITNDPLKAKILSDNGVDRIFVDLEILGKQKRQGHLDTVISKHKISDVAKIKKTISQGEVLVRINPLNNNSQNEHFHIKTELESAISRILCDENTIESYTNYRCEKEQIPCPIDDGNQPIPIYISLEELMRFYSRLEENLDLTPGKNQVIEEWDYFFSDMRLSSDNLGTFLRHQASLANTNLEKSKLIDKILLS